MIDREILLSLFGKLKKFSRKFFETIEQQKNTLRKKPIANYLNKKVERFNPSLGNPNILKPYAMMLEDPQGGYVSYKDYMELKKSYDEVWEELGRD